MTPAYVVVVLNTGFMCLGLRTLHPMESNVQNKWINEWKVTHACYFIFLSSPRLTEPSLATVIMCRVASSICDQDQNWIKQSKIFLRADQWIKITSKLQKYAKIKIKNAQIQFDLWPIKTQAIKDALIVGQSRDQAHFLPIKNLDPGHKHFNRWHKWLPLAYSAYSTWLESSTI